MCTSKDIDNLTQDLTLPDWPSYGIGVEYTIGGAEMPYFKGGVRMKELKQYRVLLPDNGYTRVRADTYARVGSEFRFFMKRANGVDMMVAQFNVDKVVGIVRESTGTEPGEAT